MKYAVKPLVNFCTAVMENAGLKAEEAELFADSLVCADMRGVSSHGVSRLETYAKRVRCGVVTAGAQLEIKSQSPSFLLIDAHNALGATAAVGAMAQCIRQAREYGSCSAAVSGGNHFGIAAYHSMYAARRGMIGLAMSNAPASVVPTGGRQPMLGTNPLSVAIPAGKYGMLCLDMATSTVAQGKVILAAKEKKDIPLGWAVDENGTPTTDPQAALRGAMLPFGGAKGYAIALIIDLLCSALSGALDSCHIHSFWDDYEHPQNLGFFVSALDVEKIMPLPLFRSRVDAMFDAIKQSACADGVEEIFIPGEIEARREQEAQREGVVLGESVIQSLLKVAQEYHVQWPF